jgi:hypothetical protein
MHKGFADLKSPADILAKMKHDLARIENDPMDTYAAFDFFVTAEHIVDWIHPDSSEKQEGNKRKRIRTGNPLLSLVSHIANGIKHFIALDPNHQSVKKIEKNEDGFDYNALDTNAFDISAFKFAGLVVETKKGNLEHANDIAKRVIEYWENELKIP